MVSAAAFCVAPLLVPGSRPDRSAEAAASGADVVISDFEDAIAAADKGKARAATAAIAVRVTAKGSVTPLPLPGKPQRINLGQHPQPANHAKSPGV